MKWKHEREIEKELPKKIEELVRGSYYGSTLECKALIYFTYYYILLDPNPTPLSLKDRRKKIYQSFYLGSEQYFVCIRWVEKDIVKVIYYQEKGDRSFRVGPEFLYYLGEDKIYVL